MDVGLDTVAEVSGGEVAQAGLGGEVRLSHSGDVNDLDGPDRPEPAEAFVRAATAHAKALGEVIEGDRFLRAEEEAVNLPDRTRDREAGHRVDEDAHALPLEVVQLDRIASARRGAGGVIGHGQSGLRALRTSCRLW